MTLHDEASQIVNALGVVLINSHAITFYVGDVPSLNGFTPSSSSVEWPERLSQVHEHGAGWLCVVALVVGDDALRDAHRLPQLGLGEAAALAIDIYNVTHYNPHP
jgi:hypothetical protein